MEERYQISSVWGEKVFGLAKSDMINLQVFKRMGKVTMQNYIGEMVTSNSIEYLVMKGIEMEVQDDEFQRNGIDADTVENAIVSLVEKKLIQKL